MVTFLYGPDSYRLLQRKKEFVADFLKKCPQAAVGDFDAEEEDGFGMCSDFLRTQSLFQGGKVGVLEHVLEVDKKPLLAIIKEFGLSKDNLLVFISPKKPTKPYSFLLEAPVSSESFEALSGPAWKKFLTDCAKEYDVMLAPAAVQFLCGSREGDAWWAATEIQKMGGLGKQTIELSDFEAMSPEALPEFWPLMNGLKSYDQGVRLQQLERVLSAHEEPAKIFHIMASMWGEKISQFANYDLAIKTGKLDYEEALLDLVL